MAMIDCPCGRYKINELEKICPYCGILLEKFSATRALPGEEQVDESTPRWGTARFNARMNLIISLRDSDRVFVFDASNMVELSIGRRDPESGENPDLDLDPFGGVEKGVSRRHAAIVRRDTGSLLLVDRGSPNGTYLNGQRLVAHQPRILRDGDEIRVGMVGMLIRFEREER